MKPNLSGFVWGTLFYFFGYTMLAAFLAVHLESMLVGDVPVSRSGISAGLYVANFLQPFVACVAVALGLLLSCWFRVFPAAHVSYNRRAFLGRRAAT